MIKQFSKIPHKCNIKFLSAIILFTILNSGCIKSQDRWELSSPSQQGMDSISLSKLDEYIKSELPHFRSLLISRNGYLVFEKYYHGSYANEFQNMQSVTKSITSALFGIALQKDYIKSLDDKVMDYFAEYKDSITDARVNEITILHLLTMSSGIDEIPTMFGKNETNPNKSTLQTKLIFNPGSGFKYSSPSAHLLSGILYRTTGISVLKFAEENLFQPLGIEKVVWYSDNNGLHLGCGSSLWRARDLLKFGQLYLNNGKWNGKELIPSAYVDESTKKHISGDFYGNKVDYGYLWWISNISSYKVFSAEGYGSQILRIIPKLDLVILCTSDWQKPVYPEQEAIIKDFIIPSVISK